MPKAVVKLSSPPKRKLTSTLSRYLNVKRRKVSMSVLKFLRPHKSFKTLSIMSQIVTHQEKMIKMIETTDHLIYSKFYVE
jgi:hypothetical protein